MCGLVEKNLVIIQPVGAFLELYQETLIFFLFFSYKHLLLSRNELNEVKRINGKYSILSQGLAGDCLCSMVLLVV